MSFLMMREALLI